MSAEQALFWALGTQWQRDPDSKERESEGGEESGKVWFCREACDIRYGRVGARNISVGAIRIQMGFKVMGGGVAVNLPGSGRSSQRRES